MISTTLRKLRDAEECEDGYKKLRCSLPKDHKLDDPIGIDYILEANGLEDALWLDR